MFTNVDPPRPSASRHRLLALTLAAVVALGACSDDRSGGQDSAADTAAPATSATPTVTEPPTTEAPTTEPPTTEAPDDTLRIGLEAPLSGDQSGLGNGMLKGAQLAAERLNADGGVLGLEVEIVAIDDAADPDTGVAAAAAALDDGLDGIVGPYNSGVGSVTLPLYLDAGLVPMRLTSATSTEGLGFTLQAMTTQIAPRTAEAMSGWLEAASVAMIVDTDQEYTTQEGDTVRAELESVGVEVTAYEEITPGDSSYAAALKAALATDPDVLYLATYFPEAAVIAQELTAEDSEVSCLASYATFDNVYLDDAGEAASRCQVLGVPSPEEYLEAGPYVAAYEEAFGEAPNVWSPYTYDSVLVLAAAIEQAGSTEATALTEALAAIDWSGWTGPVAFEPDTGNRRQNPVVVLNATENGWQLDQDWAAFAGVAA